MRALQTIRPMNFITRLALGAVAMAFNHSARIRRRMKTSDGWINFAVGIRTRTGTVAQSIRFTDGRAVVSKGIGGADVVLNASDDRTLKEIVTAPPGELLGMVLKNTVVIEGNISFLQLFNYYLSLLFGERHAKMPQKARTCVAEAQKHESSSPVPSLNNDLRIRRAGHLKAAKDEDRNVRYLEDPYLSCFDLEDFPRLASLTNMHRSSRPRLCAERPRLLTEWHRRYGFEEAAPGRPWQPVLRQGLAFEHLMRHKRPVIAQGQLLAGSTTADPVCGVVVYPDSQATLIWGELGTLDKRPLNPYAVSEETRAELNDLLHFWVDRSFHEWVNSEYGRPLCQQINDRLVAFLCSKAFCVSHTVPGLKTVLEKGTSGILEDIAQRLSSEPLDHDAQATLQGMAHALEGLEAYADALAREGKLQAVKTTDPVRRSELLHIAETCRRVPRKPAASLDEAVQSIWTAWVGMHMENTNAGLSLGRLDQWLQPYYLSDLEKIASPEGRDDYIRHAVELVGCLFLRICDHMPLSPEVGTILFGTSPPNQAVTLGGVTPEGEDGVNDMTYIFLKVTEMLGLPDPNMNARINMGKNSLTYVRRLCEVNYTTSATPSLHHDEAVFSSLAPHGYPREHMNDWSATGCVEPTISGRHHGHTGAVLVNLVAAMEMALNNGRHPLMQWDLGPRTGEVESFASFESFFDAFAAQLRFLIEQAVTLNNIYAEVHARKRPTPFMSATIEGCIEKGRDMTWGGARYNTTGTANIGLADITDSLMVVKKLVFEESRITFIELKHAVDTDFRDAPEILALVRNKVKLFGSGDRESLAMANNVAALVHDLYGEHRNYRGGRYTSGFWSMSQHTAYGKLSGALPSGRLSGKPFTPGITPEPHASKSYLDFISDVAGLDPVNMDNNMAFNVKLAPSVGDNREKTVDAMAGYVKGYCSLGGMQMQFNVVDSRTLRDAMAAPENFSDLIVRISGYNAYFVDLNRDQQLELIERAEYRL